MSLSRDSIDLALTRVGERLHAAGAPVGIVIAGGANLVLLGVIDRATSDVDIVAFASPQALGEIRRPPSKLPPELAVAVRRVGHELELDSEWFDLRVGAEWDLGLPEGFSERIAWREYGRGLRVGLAGRPDMIYFKLVASADGQHPRHLDDLRRLDPSAAELAWAAGEVRSRNVGLDESIARVLLHLGDRRA